MQICAREFVFFQDEFMPSSFKFKVQVHFMHRTYVAAATKNYFRFIATVHLHRRDCNQEGAYAENSEMCACIS